MQNYLQNEKLLDEIGWNILDALQENGRLSYSELGRTVGLSTPAVAERVKKLEDAGIITGYHAEVNPEMAGLRVTAYIRIRIQGGDINRILKLIKKAEEIVECHRITGTGAFILKAHVSSILHLEKLIDSFTPYALTETSIVLSSPISKRSLRRVA